MDRTQSGFGSVSTGNGPEASREMMLDGPPDAFARSPVVPSSASASKPVFRIRMVERRNADRRVSRLAASDGSLHFTGDRIVLLTKQRRYLQPNIEIDLQLQLSELFDVRSHGRRVFFEIHDDHGLTRRFLLKTANPADAREMAERMSTRAKPLPPASFASAVNLGEALVSLTRHAWIVYCLLVLNLALYLAMAISSNSIDSVSPDTALQWGAGFTPYIVEGQWWRLISATVIHLSALPMLVDMIVLTYVGCLTERLFGNLRFFAIYAVSALLGSLVGSLWDTSAINAGTSNAVFGVLAALTAQVVRYPSALPVTSLTPYRSVGLAYIVFSLIWGLTHAKLGMPTNLGGLAGGVAGGLFLGYALARPLEQPARSASKPGEMIGVLVLLAMITSGLAPALFVPPEAKREEMRFAVVKLQVQSAERQASIDLRRLGRLPRLPLSRTDYADELRTGICPEWDAMARMIEPSLIGQASAAAAESRALSATLVQRSKDCLVAADLAADPKVDLARARQGIAQLMQSELE